MAYQKLQSGEFVVIGYVPKDAEMKTVGSNNSSKTTFSVKCAENTKPDGTKETKWTNCVAWHDLARGCAAFKKGDSVMVVGKIEENEYNGKKYKNLIVEWANKSVSLPAVSIEISPADELPKDEVGDLSEYEDLLVDGDLPF